jgi:hypothetical protein
MRMLEGLAAAADRDLGAARAKHARAVGDVAKLIEDERDVDPRWSTFGASLARLSVSVAVAQAEVMAAHARTDDLRIKMASAKVTGSRELVKAGVRL